MSLTVYYPFLFCVVSQSKYEARSLESRLEDMTSSARDAATAATLSRLKLADYENENEELIEELIYAKMTCAQYANDFEEERKKNFADKKKLRRSVTDLSLFEINTFTLTAGMLRESPHWKYKWL